MCTSRRSTAVLRRPGTLLPRPAGTVPRGGSAQPADQRSADLGCTARCGDRRGLPRAGRRCRGRNLLDAYSGCGRLRYRGFRSTVGNHLAGCPGGSCAGGEDHAATNPRAPRDPAGQPAGRKRVVTAGTAGAGRRPHVPGLHGRQRAVPLRSGDHRNHHGSFSHRQSGPLQIGARRVGAACRRVGDRTPRCG